MCSSDLHKIEGQSATAFQLVWERMKSSIMKVSLINTDWTKDIRSIKNFTDWVDESMSYFTYSRLQHASISRPIDQTRSIGRIRSVMNKRMKYPKAAPPLRIVVFGGSVTTGHDCLDNIFDLQARNDGKSNDRGGTPAHESKICAWPGRLQDMMDETFGIGVVVVKNLAVGGANSDMSRAFMEFGLIPGSTPDVIIWDHGINDALTTVNPDVRYSDSSNIDTEQIFEMIQKFYQAAMALPTSCDNPDPPLVIMLDSLLGQQTKLPYISVALRVSSAVSKLLAWYPDSWGISSANTIRPYILTKVKSEDEMIGLLGSSSVITHPGMMYHISIAWIVMFNFVNALHDNCIISDIIETSEPSFVTGNNYLQLSRVPELHADLRMVDVPMVWKERTPEPMEYKSCLAKQRAKNAATKKYTKDSSLTCYYAWIVNSVLDVVSPQDVYAKIEPYLLTNDGWSEYSPTDPKARPGGWIVSNGSGSSFVLQFSDVPTLVNSVTIVYMQSYSEMWINSTLQIDCIFFNASNNNNTDTTDQIDLNTLPVLGHNDTSGIIQRSDLYTSVSHVISGYHDDQTSILVPIKLPFPDRELDLDKLALRLHFRLLGGQTFKIAGIALC